MNNNKKNTMHSSIVENDIIDDMPIYRMVYITQATYAILFSINFFDGMDKVIYQYNKEHNLTGVLCLGNVYFVQYFEGTEESLVNLKNRLLGSSRYINFHLYDFSRIEQRRFPELYSGFVVVDSAANKKNKHIKNFIPFIPITWSLNKQLDLFDTVTKADLVGGSFKLTFIDVFWLRLRLFRKLGSEAMTKQQKFLSLGIIFCTVTLIAMMYLIVTSP